MNSSGEEDSAMTDQTYYIWKKSECWIECSGYSETGQCVDMSAKCVKHAGELHECLIAVGL